MISNTPIVALLAAASLANALPLSGAWSSLFQAKRDLTAAQTAQGSNFYFDSLRLEDACTPGQIACISSNLVKCSAEANWEVTPCTGNTTCLAVPSSSFTSGVEVQCMLFADAQSAIASAGGEGEVAQNFGVQAAPSDEVNPNASASASASDVPATSSGEEAITTETSSGDLSATPTDETSTTDLSATPTDSASVDPSSTCTEEPEITEYVTYTVIVEPNPTNSAETLTTTLMPEPTTTTDGSEPTDTTTTDGAEPTPTCTESTEVPEPTETSTDGSEPTETSTDGSEPTETSSTEIAEPTETTTTDEPIATESSSTEDASATLSFSEVVPSPTEPASAVVSDTTSSSSIPITTTITQGIIEVTPTGPVPTTTPDCNPLGVHTIPADSAAQPSASPAKRGMERRLRRV